jgi:MFS family permease
MLSGLGSAFSFICLLVVVYEWLPRRYLALFIGLSQLVGTMGPILAAGPVNELAERGNIDWRLIFLYLGFCGLLLTFLILRFVKSMNVSPGGVHVLKVPQSMSQTIFYIFKQKQLWALALYCVSIYFTLEYLSENTGKEFLTKNGYSSSESSYFLTISWIGYAIGCPLLGLISDLSRKRKPVMFFASLLCIVSISLIIYATKIRMLVFIAFIVLGFAASGQSVGFALVSEHCRERYLASCFGFNNAAITTATSLISPMIGWLICFFSVSRVTSIFAYQKTFLTVIIFIALSLAASMLYIEETYCRSQKEPMKLEFSDF